MVFPKVRRVLQQLLACLYRRDVLCRRCLGCIAGGVDRHAAERAAACGFVSCASSQSSMNQSCVHSSIGEFTHAHAGTLTGLGHLCTNWRFVRRKRRRRGLGSWVNVPAKPDVRSAGVAVRCSKGVCCQVCRTGEQNRRVGSALAGLWALCTVLTWHWCPNGFPAILRRSPRLISRSSCGHIIVAVCCTHRRRFVAVKTLADSPILRVSHALVSQVKACPSSLCRRGR